MKKLILFLAVMLGLAQQAVAVSYCPMSECGANGIYCDMPDSLGNGDEMVVCYRLCPSGQCDV